MEIFKKSIVLSNKVDKNIDCLAIITFEKENITTIAKIKCYGINNNNLILGITNNNQPIIKQQISIKDNEPYIFKLNNFELNNKIGCVVLDITNNKIKPIIWGSTSDFDYKNIIVNSIHSENKLNNTILKKEIIENITYNDNDEKKNTNNNVISNNFENTLSTEDIITAHENLHTEKIYSNATNNKNAHLFEEDNDENIDKLIENELNNSDSDFFQLIKEQIDELFRIYPREENLELLIPNSKWVKVDYENNGKIYVVGLIYEDEVLKYICYGVPGEYSVVPPDFEGYSQWIPLKDIENGIQGYWIMYQDSNTGETLHF